MAVISVFFQYFGFFSMIGIIILTILIRKEYRKQLPTEEERKELVQLGKITADCKNKKLLRSATMELRQVKALQNELTKFVDLTNVEKTTNVEEETR